LRLAKFEQFEVQFQNLKHTKLSSVI